MPNDKNMKQSVRIIFFDDLIGVGEPKNVQS